MLVMADELSKREMLLEALQNGDPTALEFAQRAASAPNEDHEVELQVNRIQLARLTHDRNADASAASTQYSIPNSMWHALC